MKCLPFSTDSLRSSSSVCTLFVGEGVFFFTPYPKEHMVIKTINAAFLWLFLLVVNYDNGIHTQMHTCTQGSHLSAGLIVSCKKHHISPKSKEPTDLYNKINTHVCKEESKAEQPEWEILCLCHVLIITHMLQCKEPHRGRSSKPDALQHQDVLVSQPTICP